MVKDLTPQRGSEEFKSPHLGYLGYLGDPIKYFRLQSLLNHLA
jgi:hypothetical protein